MVFIGWVGIEQWPPLFAVSPQLALENAFMTQSLGGWLLLKLTFL